MEDFYRQDGEGIRKEQLPHLPLGDEKGSTCQITSLVLTRKSQTGIEMTFLGDIETAIRLGIKFRLGNVGLAQVIPFGACCLFFNRTKVCLT